MYGYIYKTTNLINGKIYIGQHKSNMFDELYYGSGTVFRRAFDRYGKENFKVELIESCDSAKELDSKERYWISKYDSKNRNVGYNIADGGSIHLDDEHLELIRDKLSMKGFENPNCRCTFEQCELAKRLLDSRNSVATVADITGLKKTTVNMIKRGEHFSCIYDNYICKIKLERKPIKHRIKTIEEIMLNKQKHKERQRKYKEKLEQEYLKEEHFCLCCHKKITHLIGKGLFCSRSCASKFNALHRDNTNLKIALKNRDYTGSKNPNYGKKHSKEVRLKISNAIKNSDKYINVIQAKRFKGKKHTAEEKEKIGNSVRKAFREKNINGNKEQGSN